MIKPGPRQGGSGVEYDVAFCDKKFSVAAGYSGPLAVTYVVDEGQAVKDRLQLVFQVVSGESQDIRISKAT